MKTMKNVLLLALALVLMASLMVVSANAEDFEVMNREDTYNVLFIGNSYTYFPDRANLEHGLWEVFKNVAESAGYHVNVERVVKGGQHLDYFLDPANAETAELQEKLAATKFDYVFLQDHSMGPIETYARFESASKTLNEMVNANGGVCVMYQTWGSKDGQPDMEAHAWDNLWMANALKMNYEKVAELLGIEVSPVGTAFLDVYTNHADEVELYDADMKHPSLAGTYLAALCHFATLTGDDPLNVTYTYDLEPNVVAILQQAAHDAVLGK